MGCGCGCGGGGGCGTQKRTAGAVQAEYVPEMEGGQPQVAAPRASYRLQCPAGCAPFGAAQCDATLRRAILDAIEIANTAVRKLTAANVDDDTKRWFRFFMGHDPSHPVPWANNEQSRVSVAKRLRSCARELGGGRWTRYLCGCPADIDPIANAWTVRPIEVRLCTGFWGASPQVGLSARFFRAGVILHEMLHQLYMEFILHNEKERRRNNASCYEALALRLAGHVHDRGDERKCRARSA